MSTTERKGYEGTKIFLAACEVNFRCCKDTPTKNWLVSYYYLRQMKNVEDFLKDAKFGLRRLGINEDRTLFLDSGAFSFQNAAGCIPGRTNKDTDSLNSPALLQYALDYLEFIKKYGHYFDIIVEVDVDYILGVRKTRYLFERMRKEVPQLRPVWHIPRGDERWREECQEFAYHGIEGVSRHKESPISFYNEFIRYSHDKKSKVHGLTA